jgi:Rho termination factor, N-terminal domain
VTRLRRPTPGPHDRKTMSELYEEARRLAIPGRSTMSRRELTEAITSAQRTSRPLKFPDRVRAGSAAAGALMARIRGHLPKSFALGATLESFISVLRTPGFLRALILSLAALATGVLGLVVAYAVVPQEGTAAAQLNGRSVKLLTVTGPGGTTTLAVTKTKRGKTKLVPVRVLRTVTGPGGVSTLAIAVAGAAVTERDVVTQKDVVTQIHQSTQTQVVTQVEPVTVVVTDVVTQPETVIVTQTVVVEVTTTVPPGFP